MNALAAFTTCDTVTEVLPFRLPSPPYCAVSVLVPADEKVKLQLNAGSVAVQLVKPSVTVTLPVGVPMPGGLTATVNVTVTD